MGQGILAAGLPPSWVGADISQALWSICFCHPKFCNPGSTKMSELPSQELRRVRHYSAIGTGLLVFLVLTVLHWTGAALENGWKWLMIGAVSAAATVPARIAARLVVQRFPTTTATYD